MVYFALTSYPIRMSVSFEGSIVHSRCGTYVSTSLGEVTIVVRQSDDLLYDLSVAEDDEPAIHERDSERLSFEL